MPPALLILLLFCDLWGRHIVLSLSLSLSLVLDGLCISYPHHNSPQGEHALRLPWRLGWLTRANSVCVWCVCESEWMSEKDQICISPHASNICETLCWCGGILILYFANLHLQYHYPSACVCFCVQVWWMSNSGAAEFERWSLIGSEHTWGPWSVYQ